MRRYITRPKGWEGDWSNYPGPAPLTITVWERENGPQKTGLLDSLGEPLYAIDEPEPIGFNHWSRK